LSRCTAGGLSRRAELHEVSQLIITELTIIPSTPIENTTETKNKNTYRIFTKLILKTINILINRRGPPKGKSVASRITTPIETKTDMRSKDQL
jgi:hypothetical protein